MVLPRFALAALLSLCTVGSASANGAASSTFYPRTVVSQQGVPTTLAPEREPVALNDRRDWVFSVEGRQPDDVTAVRLSLPREGISTDVSPRFESGHWVLPDLVFDVVGVWLVDIMFTTTAGADSAQFRLAIDTEAFVVAERPSPAQVALINAMALPRDPPPPLTATARAAATLGQQLFFDTGLSRDGRQSCASCHAPGRAFTDGRARSHPDTRNAPGLIGIADKRWFNRDGSADSLWSQALGPLENRAELDRDRVSLLQWLAAQPHHAERYAEVVGEPLPSAMLEGLPPASPRRSAAERAAWEALPAAVRTTVDRHFAEVGKLLAAYQRQLRPQPTPFDRYAYALADGDTDADTHLSDDAQRGLMLFLGSRTHCLDCHLGQHFRNNQFHNIGTAPVHTAGADPGRSRAIELIGQNPFNCAGTVSGDATACTHLDDMWRVEVPYLLTGAFLTPGLREVARTGPWFHDGSATSLMAVMEHYRAPPPSRTGRTEHELSPIALTDEELRQMVAFLEALSTDAEATEWHRAPAQPE